MLRRRTGDGHDPGAALALLAFLASEGLSALAGVLGSDAGAGARSRVAIVDFAAEPLPERDELVAGWRAALSGLGLSEVVDRPADADVVFVGGGDPFHLIDRLRSTGAGAEIVDAVRGGVPYVGLSAGAIVAGPTLDPVVTTSPFRYPPGLDLTGLGLVDLVVLPHDDREGRAERNAAAERRFAGRVRTVRLRDDQALVARDAGTELVASP